MKTSENIKAVSNQSESKNISIPYALKGVMFIGLVLLLLPVNVMAAKERYVLDFEDSHIRSHRGEAATLYLRKSLKQQYPWLDMRNMDLRKVVLVAKTKKGKGSAKLRVGEWVTPRYNVYGHPSTFKNQNRRSFDRVKFRNPSSSSRGPWQVDLQGNFIVRKVVLEVEDHRRPRYSYRWRHHNNW